MDDARLQIGGEARQGLRPLVVIATKGRPDMVAELLRHLGSQTLRPDWIVVVGACPDDLAKEAAGSFGGMVISCVCPVCGSSAQRNFGLDLLLNSGRIRPDHFMAFFDDDFLPAPDWLEQAAHAFCTDKGLSGLTGTVLADGVNGEEISPAQAAKYLSREAPQRRHWSALKAPTAVESLYGCNMAVTSQVARSCRFDEALPLYAWQEDCDYSGQARRMGKTMLMPACRGVHRGVKTARVSGLRFGYSQVANPVRIAWRGNMSVLRAARFILRAIAANSIRSFRRNRSVDYPGRLKGNLLAIADALTLRLDPKRILQL